MPELVATDRFTWERIVRRAVLPKPVKLLALILATYADADGTRVRPGNDILAAVTGDSEKNVRRLLGRLRDDLALLELVRRGGGRGGRGSASEYRLVLPTDLLERLDLLGPSEQRPVSPDTQMSAQSSPADNSERPDIQVSVQSSDPASNDRTSNSVTNRMTGHFEPIDRTSRCPTTKRPTTRRPTATYQPAQPPTARETTSTDDLPRAGDGKCSHGLTAALEADGTPRCVLCRRSSTPAA